MTLKQLQAKVKAAQKANADKISAAASVSSLEATLKLENSKTLFASKVKLAAKGQNTKVLKDLVAECSTLIDNVPIHNSKTRALRVWGGIRRFSFGTQVNLMYQIATGILYSCADHKDMLLEHTNLNLELLEQLVEAFGTPSYYSRNKNTLLEATPYSVENVLATICVMQSELGVVIDTNQLTEAAFKAEFEAAAIVADTDKAVADEAMLEVELAM